ncbi:MAG: hypothetical protein H0T11_04885 [Chthoniobacterales bacterium]|nr:hypothetical protein [Chthoniobacterales bacterium]
MSLTLVRQQRVDGFLAKGLIATVSPPFLANGAEASSPATSAVTLPRCDINAANDELRCEVSAVNMMAEGLSWESR